MPKFLETNADIKIKECINNMQDFSVVAGAGSGKTTSLIQALEYVRNTKGQKLYQNNNKVVCITYTNRAVEVIERRLQHEELFYVTTIHSFLWSQIYRFQDDIKECLIKYLLPKKIAKKQEEDNGGDSKTAIKSRKRAFELQEELKLLPNISKFVYQDLQYSIYSKGEIGHDDVIDISTYLIINNSLISKIIGQKFPYIFVDEAQDTFPEVIDALNKITEKNNLLVIGYFGDPMQQIYDKRTGDFHIQSNTYVINKEENFRSSVSVINLLNSFRNDIQQFPKGKNKEIDGSVEVILAETKEGEGYRKSYSEEQLEYVLSKYDELLRAWNWNSEKDTKILFLAKQMIARRSGFPNVQKLFSGKYASSQMEEKYSNGEHFLIKPFLNIIYPIVKAKREGNSQKIFQLIRRESPSFKVRGSFEREPVSKVFSYINDNVDELNKLWELSTTKEILIFCAEKKLISLPDILKDHLSRKPRKEEYNEELHEKEKGDWLVDEFFKFKTDELSAYYSFFNEMTPYSTQHGSKGEEYKNVLVVIDDTEAAWHNYSFSKILTPMVVGKEPTDGQREKTGKLAYVCFSRAVENLKILFFTTNQKSAKKELLEKSLFIKDQIEIM